MKINTENRNTIHFKDYMSEIEHTVTKAKLEQNTELPPLFEYTKLNLSRSKKWLKIFKPNVDMIQSVQSMKRKENWIVLTESWCGDAAQNLPQLFKISELTDKISLSLLKRDENLDLMDQFLTNGGRSIPKLIRIDTETNEVIGTWGPRPTSVQEKVIQLKSEGKEYAEEIHKWYAKDKGLLLQKEISELILSE